MKRCSSSSSNLAEIVAALEEGQFIELTATELVVHRAERRAEAAGENDD